MRFVVHSDPRAARMHAREQIAFVVHHGGAANNNER